MKQQKRHMQSKRVKYMLLLGYIFLFSAFLGIVNYHPVDSYIKTLKQQSIYVSKESGAFETAIKEWAEKIDVAPIDARIDPIWKAIPGLNGLQVNLEKSIEVSKRMGKVDRSTLIIEQVPPKKQLTDLSPQPVYRGHSEKQMVALMVNVAWGSEYIEKMLEIFDQYHIKGTFFLDGKWLKENKELALQIIKHGHELGNHAYSHPDMARLSEARMREEIAKTEKLIQELGVQSSYFAPPSGSYNNRVVQIAHEQQMKVVLWTLDTVDWRRPPKETIVQRIVPKLENGALILMHPTQPTVEALPEIIEGILNKQLVAVTVSELLSSERGGSIVRVD